MAKLDHAALFTQPQRKRKAAFRPQELFRVQERIGGGLTPQRQNFGGIERMTGATEASFPAFWTFLPSRLIKRGIVTTNSISQQLLRLARVRLNHPENPFNSRSSLAISQPQPVVHLVSQRLRNRKLLSFPGTCRSARQCGVVSLASPQQKPPEDSGKQDARNDKQSERHIRPPPQG